MSASKQALWMILFFPVLSATVVEDFNHIERCKNSLYMGTAPRGILNTKLKKICQRYEDLPRYVTLYDPDTRIPVYSAYTFKKTDRSSHVDYPWMYEPQVRAAVSTLLKDKCHDKINEITVQLAETTGNGNMMPFPTGYLHKSFEDSQAVLDDYSNVVQYERGQLNPDQHQSTVEDRAATYSLTNVVPLIRDFDIKPWRAYIEKIRIRLNNFCLGKAYIVTGVTTAGNTIRRNNQNRVGIPEEVWSAYCCTDYDVNAPHNLRSLFPSFAAIGKNNQGSEMTEMRVQDLEKHLRGKMNVDENFQIFYANCHSPSPLPFDLDGN